MHNQMIPKLIEEVVKRGVEVSLIFKNDKILFDVNTKAKSHLYLEYVPEHDTFNGYARYDNFYDNIFTLEELTCIVKECMCGRDGVNKDWVNIMVDLGYATRHREVVETVIF